MFVGEDSIFAGPPLTATITQRKLRARVRITKEALQDFDRQVFSRFMRDDLAGVARDVDRRML